MAKLLKCFFIVFIIIGLIAVPLSGVAKAVEQLETDNDLSAGMMTVDFLLVRPMGIVSTILGSVFFGISLPFSLLGGNSGDALEKMVVDPAKFTFVRPLGSF